MMFFLTPTLTENAWFMYASLRNYFDILIWNEKQKQSEILKWWIAQNSFDNNDRANVCAATKPFNRNTLRKEFNWCVWFAL